MPSGKPTLGELMQRDDYTASSLRALAHSVGGLAALEALADEPLPDEPFDWSAVEELDREVVEAVLAQSDAWCTRLWEEDLVRRASWRYGVAEYELRTATRRLLALVARRDPAPLRRGTAPARLAAGLVWAVAKGNLLVGRRAVWSASLLWWKLGVNDSSGLGRRLRVAAGVALLERDDAWCDSVARDDTLTDAGLLVGATRKMLCERLEGILNARPMPSFSDEGNGQVAVKGCLWPVLTAAKAVDDSGRAYMTLAFGDDYVDAHVLMLTVPDAYRLHQLLETALASPVPKRLRTADDGS